MYGTPAAREERRRGRYHGTPARSRSWGPEPLEECSCQTRPSRSPPDCVRRDPTPRARTSPSCRTRLPRTRRSPSGRVRPTAPPRPGRRPAAPPRPGPRRAAPYGTRAGARRLLAPARVAVPRGQAARQGRPAPGAQAAGARLRRPLRVAQPGTGPPRPAGRPALQPVQPGPGAAAAGRPRQRPQDRDRRRCARSSVPTRSPSAGTAARSARAATRTSPTRSR